MQLSELVKVFETYWPATHADDWDRVGLTVGNPGSQVNRVLVSVDLTEAVIDEAIEAGCQLILTHHPALLRGVTSVADDELKGALVSKLIRSGIATFSAHTNADVQDDGATSILANLLKLSNREPIVQTIGGFGHGVIGSLANAVSLGDFAKTVSDLLPKVAGGIRFAGSKTKLVQRVALCSGAGDSFIPAVLASKADVYITSDLRHHPTLDAIETPRENGKLALIDVSHWASESLWVAGAVERISSNPELVAIASKVITDPWTDEVFD